MWGRAACAGRSPGPGGLAVRQAGCRADAGRATPRADAGALDATPAAPSAMPGITNQHSWSAIHCASPPALVPRPHVPVSYNSCHSHLDTPTQSPWDLAQRVDSALEGAGERLGGSGRRELGIQHPALAKARPLFKSGPDRAAGPALNTRPTACQPCRPDGTRPSCHAGKGGLGLRTGHNAEGSWKQHVLLWCRPDQPLAHCLVWNASRALPLLQGPGPVPMLVVCCVFNRK